MGFATLMRSPFSKDRTWGSTDFGRVAFFSIVHLFGLAAIFAFSWKNLIAGFLMYVASGMGITYSFHRQLAHRSFRSSKWLEYVAAYCGAMAMQGGPLERDVFGGVFALQAEQQTCSSCRSAVFLQSRHWIPQCGSAKFLRLSMHIGPRP